MFYLSFQLAAPIIAALFLTDLGLGLLTRVAPQFNIFVIGAPLKMILGFFLARYCFPRINFTIPIIYLQPFLITWRSCSKSLADHSNHHPK